MRGFAVHCVTTPPRGPRIVTLGATAYKGSWPESDGIYHGASAEHKATRPSTSTGFYRQFIQRLAGSPTSFAIGALVHGARFGYGPVTLTTAGTEGSQAVDFDTQRKNMVESQVRPSDITDRRIIRAMLAVPREAFVPETARSLAYRDTDTLLSNAAGHRGEPRALLAPRTFAKLVQLAAIEPGDTVLDVGTATGYSAAVLARLAAVVVALECDAELARKAKRNVERLASGNVRLVTGDLADGCPHDGPYDAIVLEGAITKVPRVLLEQLKAGGRLVAVLSRGPLGCAAVWRRLDGIFDQAFAFDASAPLLPGFAAAPAFSL